MGLAFVGGLAGSDKSADLSRPPKKKGRQGEVETGSHGKSDHCCSRIPGLPSPCLPFFFIFLSHAHCGLWVLRDLSHRKSLRQVFDQIINIFDADREAH